MEQIEAHLADGQSSIEFVFGSGSLMRTVDVMASDVALTDIPVFIIGESGTGKDSYARLIHHLSRKAPSALIKINCSSVGAKDLVARLSPLFIENSASGTMATLYLDNIQDLDPDCQRVLISQLPDAASGQPQEHLPARLISSTTRNLEQDVEVGHFRCELYFRLNGVCLRLPALRDRREDLPILMDHFIRKHSRDLGKNVFSLSGKSLQTLTAYHWPGNIRELENVARKMVVFGDVQLALNDLQAARMLNQPTETGAGASLKVASRAASKQAERELIIQALERTRWNRKRAAHDLQISYKSLLHKIKQIGPLNGEHQC